jgi:hypothetical protein
MISSTRFWRALDEHHGPGTVLLGLLVSWRTVADQFGMDATDLVSGILDVIAGLAMPSAQVSARLSTTVIGGYWPEPQSHLSAIQWFERWIPIDLEAREMNIPINIILAPLAREAGETGRSLYGRAQTELDRIMRTLPEKERYPALSIGWDEAARS